MKKYKNIIFILLIFFLSNSFVCINEYRTLLSGEVIHTEPISGKVWTKKIDTLKLREKSNNLLSKYKSTDSLEYYSDYGATLIYLKEFQKAESVYKEIEEQKPDLYTTASNLGTVYELLNKPKLALEWIKKSVELNPKSHKGSEWIHINILEFKVNNSTEYSKSILGLDFGLNEIPSNENKYNLIELREHIWHQLKERSNFVKPENKIVGNLYFDLGNILAQTVDVQSALESFESAKEYGYESDLMNKRIIALEKLADKAKPKQYQENTIDFIKHNIGLFFCIGLICLILILIMKKKRRKTKG